MQVRKDPERFEVIETENGWIVQLAADPSRMLGVRDTHVFERSQDLAGFFHHRRDSE